MESDDWLAVLTKIALPFGVGVVAMAAVNVVLLRFLSFSFPSASFNTLRICIHPVLAAVQEPFTSKLLPAVFIVWLARREGWTERVVTRRYHYGLIGGLTVGGVEWGSKLIDSLSLSLTGFPPILMHTVNGLLIGTAVFRIAGKEKQLKDYAILLLAIALAVLIHVFWNTRVAFWMADLPPCLTS